MDAVTVVQQQLEAYNARDLERFLALYAEDIVAYRPPAAEPVLSGKAAFAGFYRAQRFCHEGLHAELLGRLVLADKVFDHERISGVTPAPFELVVAYCVRDGLIRATWAFAPG